MTPYEKLLLATNVIMVLAILLGPIAAVRATRALDDRKEERGRKIQTFRTLMATRATNLSPEHVDALNSIDLNFTGKSKAEREVREAWKLYLDWLSQPDADSGHWAIKRVDLLVELLDRMGKSLNFDFDRAQVRAGIYSPRAHGDLENDQMMIRKGLREILEGKRVFPIVVVNLHEVGGTETPPDVSGEKDD